MPIRVSMIELMEQYLHARGVQRRIRGAPPPERPQAAFTAGNTPRNARTGKTTWEEWLKRFQTTRRGHKSHRKPSA
jgi:hypothetical protein